MKKKKLIQILLPLKDQKGQNFPQALYANFKIALTNKFGGITTYTRAPATGLWKNEKNNIELDSIAVYEVIADTFDKSYWLEIKKSIEEQFSQDEIVILSINIDLL